MTPDEELDAWLEIFTCGLDHSGAAADAGLKISEDGRPDLDEAFAAWRRLRRMFMARHAIGFGNSWAERTLKPEVLNILRAEKQKNRAIIASDEPTRFAHDTPNVADTPPEAP